MHVFLPQQARSISVSSERASIRKDRPNTVNRRNGILLTTIRRARYRQCVRSKPSAPWTARPDFSDLNVLLVDDEPDGRAFVREVLRDCGATVLETDNIATAKDCVLNSKFDLIVTDLAFPGEDGVEFLSWLRQQPRENGGSTLAVAVTAFYQDHPPATVPGWAAYFQKPIEMGQFVTAIADLLRAPRS
jgi:CheY-like chemotaxis protein